MQEANAIEVQNIKKVFKVYPDKGHTLKELTLFRKRRQYEKRLVLDGISFSVKKGEAVGLIGQNGCGKSTTLKLLSRIMYPDSGTIEMRGRVSSLIELGAGFHPDMSGRQNIYINASIFGLTRKEIESRIPDIIQFSELEEFIDNPVRTYSSGMYMRLAFAIAINVDADILLIDEILAVGDANFQAKCFSKLREIKGRGVTIVIVSHALGQIEQICERSIWIKDGKIELEGAPRDIHPCYMDYMGKNRNSINVNRQIREVIVKSGDKEEIEYWSGEQKIRWGSGEIRIISAEIYNEKNEKTNTIQTGAKCTIKVKYEVRKPIDDIVLGTGFYRSDGVYCYGTNTMLERLNRVSMEKDGEYSLVFKHLELLPGEYLINLTLERGLGLPVDFYTQILRLVVYSDISDEGICRLTHEWVMPKE